MVAPASGRRHIGPDESQREQRNHQGIILHAIVDQTGPAPNGGPSAQQSQGAASPAIDVRSTPLGKILVDAKGRTLYLFEADEPNMSNCSGACLSVWPAFTSQGKPQAHGGALAAKIGTISTSNGKQQVTYDGHPLYYHAADQKPGDTNGQGLKQFGAAWYVLSTTGNKIDMTSRVGTDCSRPARQRTSFFAQPPSRATVARLGRYLGALALLGVGVDQIEQTRAKARPGHVCRPSGPGPGPWRPLSMS